ncbi:MAG: TIGR04086 family membrane protein [Firmicutes bacterium]|nr:TIGR04086 family membrane protein [Bacillota bacterium]
MFIPAVFSGLLYAWVVLALGCLFAAIASLLLDLNQGIMPMILTWISYAAVIIGGLVAGRRYKRRGIIVGGVVGLAYVLLILAIGSAGGGGMEGISTIEALERLAFSIAAGALGGILGVNLGAS